MTLADKPLHQIEPLQALPVPLPRNSPVLVHPVGNAAAGAALPTVPAVLLSRGSF